MDGLKAIETINSWRRILIEGSAPDIERMLVEFESGLVAKGWARDPSAEARLERSARGKNRWYCFVGGPTGGPQLMLGLTRVSDRRVLGGTYSLLDGPPEMQTTDVAQVVEDVIQNVLTPAASNLEFKVTIPRLGTNSRIPYRTFTALQAFSDSATGERTLSTDQELLWRRFMIRTCRDDAAFDIDELLDWFVDCGWSSKDAHVLTERFMSDAILISEYDDEINA